MNAPSATFTATVTTTNGIDSLSAACRDTRAESLAS